MPNRCKWCNPNNPKYIAYHDREWGVLRTDDAYLFEMLLLESFQAGLSWECILNKRENFRKAFDDFQAEKIAAYTAEKCSALAADKGIGARSRQASGMRRSSLPFPPNSAAFITICASSHRAGSFTKPEKPQVPCPMPFPPTCKSVA